MLVWLPVLFLLMTSLGTVSALTCAAGAYTGAGTTRCYPPTPTAGSYSWVGGTSLSNTLTVSASNTGATYGLGGYTVVCSSSVVVGSSNNAGSVFNYAMNENNQNIWYPTYAGTYTQFIGVYYSTKTLGGKTGEWIYIRLPVPVVLTQYVLNAWTGSENRAPQRWYVLGSQDATTWTQIDSQDYATGTNYGYAAAGGAYTSSTLTASTAYSYFALVVNAIGKPLSDTTTGLNLWKWQLFGYEASCPACSAGTYSTGTGLTLASTCALCSAGTFSTGTGLTLASTCASCAAGTYSTGTGLTLAGACAKCSAGTYSTGTGVSTCVQCSAGAYSTGIGLTLASACALCSAGTFWGWAPPRARAAGRALPTSLPSPTVPPGPRPTLWSASAARGTTATGQPARRARRATRKPTRPQPAQPTP